MTGLLFATQFVLTLLLDFALGKGLMKAWVRAAFQAYMHHIGVSCPAELNSAVDFVA